MQFGPSNARQLDDGGFTSAMSLQSIANPWNDHRDTRRGGPIRLSRTARSRAASAEALSAMLRSRAFSEDFVVFAHVPEVGPTIDSTLREFAMQPVW